MRAIDGSACEPARCTRLKSRAEFLHVARGRRWHGAAMTIQAAARPVSGGAPTGAGSRFGFTVTKKVGNAVVRNRIRRRLREVVRLARPDGPAKAGHDYVVVGRVETLRTPFVTLGDELERGLLAVHGSRRRDSQRLEHRSVAASQDGSTPGLAPSGRNGAERIRPRS